MPSATRAVPLEARFILRHCERNEAIQNLSAGDILDCVVARAPRNDRAEAAAQPERRAILEVKVCRGP